MTSQASRHITSHPQLSKMRLLKGRSLASQKLTARLEYTIPTLAGVFRLHPWSISVRAPPATNLRDRICQLPICPVQITISLQHWPFRLSMVCDITTCMWPRLEALVLHAASMARLEYALHEVFRRWISGVAFVAAMEL
jgi:hypothetical protein